jgi:superfamily II DNA/RNA helicase
MEVLIMAPALEAGVDIPVGTPGRIIDYFKQNVSS